MSDAVSHVGGLHAGQALLKSDAQHIQVLHVQAGRKDARMRRIRDLAAHVSVQVVEKSRAELDAFAGTRDHQGVLAEYLGKSGGSEHELLSFLSQRESPLLLLILDEVQDPHNLGACLRSADAAGVHAVITPSDNSVGITPVVRKVASGAAESVALFQVTNLQRTIKQLQDAGVWVFGAAGEAEMSLFQMDLTGSVALVMGAEGRGMRRLTRETCDGLFAIPMLGQVGSLNVSVAAGITLFEARRQRIAAG